MWVIEQVLVCIIMGGMGVLSLLALRAQKRTLKELHVLRKEKRDREAEV